MRLDKYTHWNFDSNNTSLRGGGYLFLNKGSEALNGGLVQLLAFPLRSLFLLKCALAQMRVLLPLLVGPPQLVALPPPAE